MRLGQTVYWVTHDKAQGEHATVRVNQGGFHGRDGQAVTVMKPVEGSAQGLFGLELIDRPTLFTDRAEADTFAMGAACRLMGNFNYKRVTVVDAAGVARQFTPPVEVRPS